MDPKNSAGFLTGIPHINCLDPSTSPPSTRAIIELPTNAIKLTEP